MIEFIGNERRTKPTPVQGIEYTTMFIIFNVVTIFRTKGNNHSVWPLGDAVAGSKGEVGIVPVHFP